MGGKGRRRREKNYRAAHGGHNRLPPPPVPSSVDALPYKLRKIMSYANSSHSGFAKSSLNTLQTTANKKLLVKDKLRSRSGETTERGKDGNSVAVTLEEHDDDLTHNSTQEQRKKIKKRKRVDDLRFEALEGLGVGSGRRERKKKRLKERKEKLKKAQSGGKDDFPGHERIEFGDIIKAPPKLLTIPKALKSSQNASQERLRSNAIEAYRNRKGWTSRPGIDLPSPVMMSPAM